MVLVVFLGLLAVASRLVYLQVLNHERFTTLSDGNRIRVHPCRRPGDLFSTAMASVLADNLASYHLEITREQVAGSGRDSGGAAPAHRIDGCRY
jgi:penicillin-binding protein 2